MKDDHGTWTTMTIIAFTMCQEGPPWGLNDKESACQAGDEGLIPASGRSPGEGNGNPLRYSCLGNPMDRGASQTAESGMTWRVKTYMHRF